LANHLLTRLAHAFFYFCAISSGHSIEKYFEVLGHAVLRRSATYINEWLGYYLEFVLINDIANPLCSIRVNDNSMMLQNENHFPNAFDMLYRCVFEPCNGF